MSRRFAISALFLLFFAACSKGSSNSTPSSPQAPLTPAQLKLALGQLAVNLSGSWQSAGPTVDQRFQGNETLTFNAALDHLIIQNCWSLCEMKTDYDLTIQPEQPDGNIYFSVHSDSLGQLVGTAEPGISCTQYLETFTNTSWDENFSLTHDAAWTQITVDETVFFRVAEPQPSPSNSSS